MAIQIVIHDAMLLPNLIHIDYLYILVLMQLFAYITGPLNGPKYSYALEL